MQYGNITWTNIDDDLGSPHEGIVMEIGKKDTDVKREVIDWRQFDWPAYKSLTGHRLGLLQEQWTISDELDVDSMVLELSNIINECVAKVANTKVISVHSKPWISRDIADLLKRVRKQKKKCRLRKSRANVQEYKKVQAELLIGLK